MTYYSRAAVSHPLDRRTEKQPPVRPRASGSIRFSTNPL
jgi:hypothetical protein